VQFRRGLARNRGDARQDAGTAPTSSNGRVVVGQLWKASRPLSIAVAGWVVLGALAPSVVTISLGIVVGKVPAAARDGLGSPAGHSLIAHLVVTALLYAASLIVDPIGAGLRIAVRQKVTNSLQARLMAAVSSPIGTAHLDDPDVLDRLALAEGSLTGYFPGDAPVTWAGMLAGRVSGIVGCLVIARYIWWVGLLLLVVWLAVRRVMLKTVITQATAMRRQAQSMRRAWYFIGLGTKAPAAKEVRVFGLSDFVDDGFRTNFIETMKKGDEGLRRLHARAAICLVFVVAIYATACAAIAHDAVSGRLGLTAIATVLPMLGVSLSVGNVTMDDITLAWTLAGIPAVDQLEDELSPTTDVTTGAAQSEELPRSMIRFEGVGFAYPGSDREVLDDLDLELPAGTSTALVGNNGAGKTTLVSLLARLNDPTRGRITVDGSDLTSFDAQGWQRRIAVVFQQPVHYPISAFDNIALGAIEHHDDEEGVRAVAAQAGILDAIEQLPNGWLTVLSREMPRGVDLSGGQWQRLSLARALFAARHGAKVLVLDEPTASLDVRGEAEFYERFLDITRGLTTVVISHRFSTVRQADRICVLDSGRIVEQGDHETLAAAGGLYANMYAVQAQRFTAKKS
jgi:ATP-binding cassette, subfamily B, bacterial